METGKIKCERCNGRGYKRVRFYYEEKSYYYMEDVKSMMDLNIRKIKWV